MQDESGGQYRIRVHDDPARIDTPAWNDLLQRQSQPTPFMRHEYLVALHESGSATADTGWTPCFVTVEQAGELRAACPAYLKSHSYGEYVFDWAWADAYHRHGLRYYPKLLCAVPFTPVPGTRWLASDPGARRVLAGAVHAIAQGDRRLSSAHLLFHSPEDGDAAAALGWLPRRTVQFHWTNREPEPYVDFNDYLACLQREKRKKIAQERRRVQEAGVRFEVLEGAAIEAECWDFFHRCYGATYAAHHSTPYLTRDFFARMAATMPEHWCMFVAVRGGRRIAASLVALDRTQQAAWGRYWGCIEPLPCLHFEACYYQPLQWCIEQRMKRFEGGAQGEHKMARGLLPEPSASMHWLADPRFADAVADYLRREGQGMDGYVDELRERNPFKTSAGT